MVCKSATLKTTKIGFQDQLLLNAGQKYYRMLQGEHLAINSTFIKLPFAIKMFVLSIFVTALHKFSCMILTLSKLLTAKIVSWQKLNTQIR